MKAQTKKPLSKKTKTILCISILTAVFLITTIICLTFFLHMDAQKKSENALDELLSGLATEYDSKIVTVFEENNGYEFISFEKKGNEAVAILRVYAPDLYNLVHNLPNTEVSEEEMEKEILERISNEKIVEKEVELTFVKKGNNYQPVLTSEFLDAYYGGLYRLKEEYTLARLEDMKR